MYRDSVVAIAGILALALIAGGLTAFPPDQASPAVTVLGDDSAVVEWSQPDSTSDPGHGRVPDGQDGLPETGAERSGTPDPEAGDSAAARNDCTRSSIDLSAYSR